MYYLNDCTIYKIQFLGNKTRKNRNKMENDSYLNENVVSNCQVASLRERKSKYIYLEEYREKETQMHVLQIN